MSGTLKLCPRCFCVNSNCPVIHVRFSSYRKRDARICKQRSGNFFAFQVMSPVKLPITEGVYETSRSVLPLERRLHSGDKRSSMAEIDSLDRALSAPEIIPASGTFSRAFKPACGTCPAYFSPVFVKMVAQKDDPRNCQSEVVCYEIRKCCELQSYNPALLESDAKSATILKPDHLSGRSAAW
jgi:hypothetical protein